MCVRECLGETHQRKARKQDEARGEVELQCGPLGGVGVGVSEHSRMIY